MESSDFRGVGQRGGMVQSSLCQRRYETESEVRNSKELGGSVLDGT